MSGQTHTLNFVYDCDLAEVLIDPTLIQHILINLLSNAIKYTPKNGSVSFAVTNDSDHLIFRISDSGIGIPERDKARLFQPFHRAANTGGITGTGLGLSIVKSYVEVHGGQIE